MTTALARQLHDPPSEPRATALDAFRLARRTFMAGERIEMQAIAAAIGTSRVTLHRWVGSRDQLLGEILWSIAEPTLEQARRAARARGGKGIAQTVERFIELVRSAPYMRAFLEREPEIALRVLTTKSSPLQERLVAAMRAMLADEVDAGRLDPPLNLDDLAYAVIRLGESFLYTDVIAGKEPSPHLAGQAIAALLR